MGQLEEGTLRLNIIENMARYIGTSERHCFKDVKITISELSKKTGLSKNTLKNAKYNGLGGLFTFAKIAAALNITIDDLLKTPEVYK